LDWSRSCTRIGVAKAYLDSSRSCTRIGAQGLIRLGSMIYSNKVYITMSSGVRQPLTRIQEQRRKKIYGKIGSLSPINLALDTT
jgi:hypothetical protein